jgi:hypothetical protein
MASAVGTKFFAVDSMLSSVSDLHSWVQEASVQASTANTNAAQLRSLIHGIKGMGTLG